MGKPSGFLEIGRQKQPARPVHERVRDWREVYLPHEPQVLRGQASRCMDCGIPFCHQGCPLGNLIPSWNDLVCAIAGARRSIACTHQQLSRLPAACVRRRAKRRASSASTTAPVTIKDEAAIVVAPSPRMDVARPPVRSTGRHVAVVGSGPAGLAAADQLNQAGHTVTVFERADRIGGLLRYGIPEFKLEKRVLDRRLALLQAEGVVFRTRCHVGIDISADDLLSDFDAVVLAGGARPPRVTCACRAASWMAFTSRWTTSRRRTAAVRGTSCRHPRSSRRRASRW